MQLFAPQESQALIQFHGRRVRYLRFKDNLICITCNHCIDGFLNERSSYSMAAIGRGYGEHGDVAAEGGRGVGLVNFQFVDYHAYERGGLGINCLIEVLEYILYYEIVYSP